MIFAPWYGTRHHSRIEMRSFGIGVGTLVASTAQAFAVAAARRIGVWWLAAVLGSFLHRGGEVGRG